MFSFLALCASHLFMRIHRWQLPIELLATPMCTGSGTLCSYGRVGQYAHLLQLVRCLLLEVRFWSAGHAPQAL